MEDGLLCGEVLEFLLGGAVIAELIDGSAQGRKGERGEGFGEHFVQVFGGGDAGGDVKFEMFAGMLGDVDLDVVDGGFVDVGIGGSGDKGGGGAGGDGEGSDGGDEILLKLHEGGSALDDDAGEADTGERFVGEEVILESFELEAGDVVAGHDFAGGGVDLVEVGGSDVALEHGDVRAVGGVERETLGEDGAEAGVGGFGVLDHDGVGLEGDVNGGDGRLLRGAGDGMSQEAREEESGRSEKFCGADHG